MQKDTIQASKQEREFTDAMFDALNELGREVEKDHICNRCLSKMGLSVGFVGGLRVVLYECKHCGHEDIREMIG